MVPFWSTIFARPGIVAAASHFIVPPQLRAKGAQTVFFDLYLNNRVGTPSKPADPGVIQARADKLFDTAVTSSGLRPSADRGERALRGAAADAVDCDDGAVPRERARLPAAARRARRAAVPAALEPARTPTTDADAWWQAASQVADLVPEVVLLGAVDLEAGRGAGSRRLRATMRTRMEDLIQIGVPTNRLGMMLTFSSTPKAGGREGLQPLSKWLDVVKWEALAAAAGRGGAAARERLVVGLGGVQPSRQRPRQAHGRLHVALDARPLALRCAGPRRKGFRPVARRRGDSAGGNPLPARLDPAARERRLRPEPPDGRTATSPSRRCSSTRCSLQAAAVDPKRVAQAEVDTILDHFRGSRAAYLAALARAKATPALARRILADELRRRAVESTLRVACAEPGRAAGVVRHVRDDARPARAGRPGDAVARQPAERDRGRGRRTGAVARARGRASRCGSTA